MVRAWASVCAGHLHSCGADDLFFLFLCLQRALASMADGNSAGHSARHISICFSDTVTTWRLTAIRASKLSNLCGRRWVRQIAPVICLASDKDVLSQT